MRRPRRPIPALPASLDPRDTVVSAIEATIGPLRFWSRPPAATDRLDRDLGLDSMGLICLAAELEGALASEIPDDDVAAWRTVADVARTVERITAGGGRTRH